MFARAQARRCFLSDTHHQSCVFVPLRDSLRWVAEGPTAGSAPSAAQPVLLILDFEGGGNVDGPNGEDELIEVPVMAMR